MRTQLSRRTEFPRNHFTIKDHDHEVYNVYLDGNLVDLCVEANIRGKWIKRLVRNKTGGLVQEYHNGRPTIFLKTELVYGNKVEVHKIASEVAT